MKMDDIEVGVYYRHNKFKDTLYLGIESYDRGYLVKSKKRLAIVHCSKASYIGKGVPHEANAKAGYYENFYKISNEDAYKILANPPAE